MTAYEVGETVPLTEDIEFNNRTYLTTGIEALILARQQISTTEEGDPIYIYQVDVTAPYLDDEGQEVIEQILVWVTSAQVGIEQDIPPLYDLNEVNSTVSTQLGVAAAAEASIQQILDTIDPRSPVHQDVQSYLAIAASDKEGIEANSLANLPEEEHMPNAFNTQTIAEQLGFESELAQEMAENLLGVYNVISEIEDFYKTIYEQGTVQLEAALQDDETNSKVYFETFVDTPQTQNVFIPKDDSEPDGPISPEVEFDYSVVEALLSPSLDLEQG